MFVLVYCFCDCWVAAAVLLVVFLSLCWLSLCVWFSLLVSVSVDLLFVFFVFGVASAGFVFMYSGLLFECLLVYCFVCVIVVCVVLGVLFVRVLVC